MAGSYRYSVCKSCERYIATPIVPFQTFEPPGGGFGAISTTFFSAAGVTVTVLGMTYYTGYPGDPLVVGISLKL